MVFCSPHTAQGLRVKELCNGVEEVMAELLGALLVAAIQSDGRDQVIRGICALDGGVQSHLKAVIEGAVTAVPVATMQSAADAEVSAGEERASTTTTTTTTTATESSEYVQKEQILADEHIRKRLETVTEELEDAYTMHDAILLELQTKNKQFDELQFQCQDAMHAVDRVKVLEEELESLHGMELKFVKMKADSERFKQALDEAKPRLQDLATLQGEHTSAVNTNRDQAAKIELLEARVKQYRINVSSSELKLSELRASMERKDAEMSRLVQTKNALTDEVKSLKVAIASLEGQLSIREQAADQSIEDNIDADGQVADAEQRVHLVEECARLRKELDGKQNHNIEIVSLEDRIADSAAFAAGLEAKIKAQTIQNAKNQQAIEEKDSEIQQLYFKLETFAKQAATERSQNDVAHQQQSTELHSLRAEVHKFAQEAQTAQMSQKHLETQLRMVKKQQEARRLSNVTQTFELPAAPVTAAKELPQMNTNYRQQQTFSQPPWANTENVGSNHPHNITDADRIAELNRRNKARQPHLRSSHAIEMQTQKDTSDFWGKMQSSAYEISPKKKGPRSPVQQAQAQFRSQLNFSGFANEPEAKEPAKLLAFTAMDEPEQELIMVAPADPPVEVADSLLGGALQEKFAMPKAQVFAVAEPKTKSKMPSRMANKMAEDAKKKEAKLAKMIAEKEEQEAAEKKAKKKKGTTKYSNVKSKLGATRAPATKQPADENAMQSKAKVGSTKAVAPPAAKKLVGPPSAGRGRQLPNVPTNSAPPSPGNFLQVHRGVSSPFQSAEKDPLACTMKSTGKSTPLASRRLNMLVDEYSTPAR
jgi:hypothetical protein